MRSALLPTTESRPMRRIRDIEADLWFALYVVAASCWWGLAFLCGHSFKRDLQEIEEESE